MSNNDSLDEETKRILAEANTDAQSSTNDSKESNNKKMKKDYNPPEEIRWETNTEEDPDSDW